MILHNNKKRLFACLFTLFACFSPIGISALEPNALIEPSVEMAVSEPPPPLESPADLPTEDTAQRLADIQVLLMYICGIAIFWTFVGCGKLLYRFFNMFF